MSQPAILPRLLTGAIKDVLISAGNPFHNHESNEFHRPIVITVDQRRDLVAGLRALEGRLAGPDAEQLVANALAAFCLSLTTAKVDSR